MSGFHSRNRTSFSLASGSGEDPSVGNVASGVNNRRSYAGREEMSSYPPGPSTSRVRGRHGQPQEPQDRAQPSIAYGSIDSITSQDYATMSNGARTHSLTILLLCLGRPVDLLFWNDTHQGHTDFIEYGWPLYLRFMQLMEEQHQVSLAVIQQPQNNNGHASGHHSATHMASEGHPQVQPDEVMTPRPHVYESNQQNDIPLGDAYSLDTSFGENNESISSVRKDSLVSGDHQPSSVAVYQIPITHDDMEMVGFQESFYQNALADPSTKATHSTDVGLFNVAPSSRNSQFALPSRLEHDPPHQIADIPPQNVPISIVADDSATSAVEGPTRLITGIDDVPTKLQATIRSLVVKSVQIGHCPISPNCTFNLGQEQAILQHIMGPAHLDIQGKTLHLVYDRSRNEILTKNHITDCILGVIRCLSDQTLATQKVFNAKGKLGYRCTVSTGCGQVEKDRYNVTRHIKAEHLGIHESHCNTCDTWFTREDNLKQHSAIHQ